jgi:hypothetical protein
LLTPKEWRHHAESCLKLARDTPEIYAKVALIELAEELRSKAEQEPSVGATIA